MDSVLQDVERLIVATYEGLLGTNLNLQFDSILSRRIIMPNRLGGTAMGASPCADAAYVAAYAKMLSFVDSLDISSVALSLLSESSQHRENSDSYQPLGFYEEQLRKACNTINNAAASDATLIDADPATGSTDKENEKTTHDESVGTPAPLAPFSHLHSVSLSQKVLSKPLWNRFYNSTVLMAQGLSDQTLRDMHLTLLNEGCEASGFHGCLNPASPLTRLTSIEFATVLRLIFGLPATGNLDPKDGVYKHFCKNKPMLLDKCPAAKGEVALAKGLTHLQHCGQTTTARHTALEISLLEMIKKAQYGWGWRREVTLYSPGEDDDVPKTWRSDLVGYDPSGALCLIDTTAVTVPAASYRNTRRTLRSRCRRVLKNAVTKKLNEPRAATRAKDLGAKHIIFAMSSNGALSQSARDFFNAVKQHVQEQGRTYMGISFRDTVTSFNTRFWGSYWIQRLCCALVGTSAVRTLRVIATDRLRSASSGKSAPSAPREFGRLGYDTPVAQPTTFHLKPLHIDDANCDACDDPGGDIDDPGGGSTNNEGSFNRFTTSASTFSKAPASYVSSSLTTKVSLLKSAADVVKCTDVDYATGSFCSSCSIPPPITGGLWSTGKGCAMCDYGCDDNYGG